MSKPNPKYGWFGVAADEKSPKWLVETENEHLKRQVQCLNEVIDELARELPQDLILKYTVEPLVQVQTSKLDELTLYHRVPKRLKGRPERVPDEHFLDLLF